jgi:hypothetical protein
MRSLSLRGIFWLTYTAAALLFLVWMVRHV